MTRHDHHLANHIASCRDDLCDFCEGLAEDRAHPEPLSAHDEREWASRWENARDYWAEYPRSAS